jgi:hypothetical protein
MGKISKLVAQRCPICGSTEARRAPRRGVFERLVLSSLAIRPFRCQECANRFYALKSKNGAATEEHRRRREGTGETIPVIVYGHGLDHEPFQEQTNVRLLSNHRAEFRLATEVHPRQKLVLLDPTSDEERRCRVKSVTEPPEGNSIVCVQFRDSVLKFWINTRPPDEN